MHYRVATDSSFLINGKSEGRIAARNLQIRSGDETILESRDRLAMLANGGIVIGNGKARIVLKRSGDILMTGSGNIKLNAQKIDLN